MKIKLKRVTKKEAFALVDSFPDEVNRATLAKILRGRRKAYHYTMNMKGVWFKRSAIRDYLKKKYPDVRQAPARTA